MLIPALGFPPQRAHSKTFSRSRQQANNGFIGFFGVSEKLAQGLYNGARALWLWHYLFLRILDQHQTRNVQRNRAAFALRSIP